MIIKILAVLGKVLLCLLALILWVVIIPRSFWVEYTARDKVCLWVRLIFFKVKIYPLPKLPSFKKGEKKPSRELKSEKDKGGKPNISDDLQLSFDLVKQTVSAFKGVMKRVLKAIKFKDISFTLPIHKEDAFETRQAYGKATTAFYTLSSFLQMYVNISFKNPIFVADFGDKYRQSVYFYGQITASPLLLLAAALYGFKRYKTILENNKKADIAKEKEN
mgnify:FL=1